MNTKTIVAGPQQPFEVSLPGSKYLANRYIPLAAISDGVSELSNVPTNDDIKAALRAFEQLGAVVERQADGCVKITGIGTDAISEPVTLNCHDSGTLARFITALAATKFASDNASKVIIDGSDQMRRRPMHEIVAGLEQLGVGVTSNKGYLPIEVAGPIAGGQCELDASRSSQFLSGLLIACLKAREDSLIHLTSASVSESYVELTLRAIELFKGRVQRINSQEFLIPAQQRLKARSISVPGDVVSASYFMVAALLAKTTVTIRNYHFDSPQGEAKFPQLLEQFGAKVYFRQHDLVVEYAQPLRALEVDMGNMPDVVPSLVVLACFIDGQTRITNIAHLAYKESNRIVDLCEQLKRLGAKCEYDEDSITIHGGKPLQAGVVSSCHDHRLAMSFALLGIRVSGVQVSEAQAVSKSFPDYWRYLEQIGMVIEEQHTAEQAS